jgi:hypothetical protein
MKATADADSQASHVSNCPDQGRTVISGSCGKMVQVALQESQQLVMRERVQVVPFEME